MADYKCPKCGNEKVYAETVSQGGDVVKVHDKSTFDDIAAASAQTNMACGYHEGGGCGHTAPITEFIAEPKSEDEQEPQAAPDESAPEETPTTDELAESEADDAETPDEIEPPTEEETAPA